MAACTTSSDNNRASSPDLHNSQNALYWAGVYASDSALLTIAADQTYVLEEKTGADTVSKTAGSFAWDAEGRTIKTDNDRAYTVGENNLTQLQAGQTPGETTRFRKEVASLTNVYWRLSEINSKPASEFGVQLGREAYLLFDGARKTVGGNSGCNRIFGGYELEGGPDQISFKQMGGTRMMCPSMELETEFTNTIEQIRAYEVSDRRLFLKDENGKIVLGFERGLSAE